MRKQRLFFLSILSSLILISACKMPDMQSSGPKPPPPAVVEAPPAVQVEQRQVVDDVKLVSAALIERLRGGRDAVSNVTFAPDGQHAVGEMDFSYAGFDVQDVAVTGYNVAMLDSGTAQAMLEGIIVFKDMINRRSSIYFATQYTMTTGAVNIVKSVVVGIPADFPRVETFFVPEKKLQEKGGSLKNYADYYLFAIENAEPMTYGEDGKKTGLNSKYYIMTFCKDRLFDESELTMRVTSRPFGAGKKLADAISINDSGWRILIAGGKFIPGSRASKFYVGVSYRQDPKGYLPTVVVGEFHNVKEDANAVAASPAAAASAQREGGAGSAQAGSEGPLARGEKYLNPVFPEDVKVIQIRLQELGLYTYKIDQNFGPRTRKALDAFAVRNGLPEGQWSIGIQKALFKGTGL